MFPYPNQNSGSTPVHLISIPINTVICTLSQKNKTLSLFQNLKKITDYNTTSVMYSVHQWYSTWGTRVICDTLTKKLWHFAFIFTWHFWRKMLRKWHPGKTNAKYKLTWQAISPVYMYCMYNTYIVNVHNEHKWKCENVSWKYHKIYKY